MYRYNRPRSVCMENSAANRGAFQKNNNDLAARIRTNQTQPTYDTAASVAANSTYRTADARRAASNQPAEKKPAEHNEESNVVFKHEKDGLSIHITIYNTNNNANEGSEAGLKQKAETGGQISGKGGQIANQGGQIAGKCGQNANQDGEVSSGRCGKGESEGCKDGGHEGCFEGCKDSCCEDCCEGCKDGCFEDCCEGCEDGCHENCCCEGYGNGGYEGEGYENGGYEAEGYETRGYEAEGYETRGYEAEGHPGGDEVFYPDCGCPYEQ